MRVESEKKISRREESSYQALIIPYRNNPCISTVTIAMFQNAFAGSGNLFGILGGLLQKNSTCFLTWLEIYYIFVGVLELLEDFLS